MEYAQFDTLADADRWFAEWLRQRALPLWADRGVDAQSGLFEDALGLDGARQARPRRARVQARQVYVYATATRRGLGRDWLTLAERGFSAYRRSFQRRDGLYAVLVERDGRVTDDTPYLYEQAFTLLALSALYAADSAEPEPAEAALRLLHALDPQRHAGGYREYGDHPFQANATMHLLEAALAWEDVGSAPEWRVLADELVHLCRSRFIDPTGGFLREFFSADWSPASGDDGRWVEPGHQFEWASLLERWGRSRGDEAARAQARQLFQSGLRGVRASGVAVNVLWDDLTVRDGGSRLWAQTEYLKAALLLDRPLEALRAASALAAFLDVPTPGLWRDKVTPAGVFVDEPAPASSFYHIMAVLGQLAASV